MAHDQAYSLDRALDAHVAKGNIISWAWVPTPQNPHRRMAVLHNGTDLEMLTTREGFLVARALASVDQAVSKRFAGQEQEAYRAARPDTDTPIGTITPRLQLVVDASSCIVLRSETERHTIGHATNFARLFDLAKTEVRIREDRAKELRIAYLQALGDPDQPATGGNASADHVS